MHVRACERVCIRAYVVGLCVYVRACVRACVRECVYYLVWPFIYELIFVMTCVVFFCPPGLSRHSVAGMTDDLSTPCHPVHLLARSHLYNNFSF